MYIKHVAIDIKYAWNIKNYRYVWDVSNTNQLIFNNSPNKYKWSNRVLSSKETESSTRDTYKNWELTAKTAARQEYSTSISEAQEYSKWKSGACLSPTHEC